MAIDLLPPRRLEALPRLAFADNFASSTSFFRVLLSYYVVLGMGQSLQVMVNTTACDETFLAGLHFHTDGSLRCR